MASTNKTTNLGLSLWQGHEYLQRDDINSDHTIIDQTIGNTTDTELLEELKGKSVVEMIKYLQEMVLEEDTELNVSLTTDAPVASTSSKVKNGQGINVVIKGSFTTNLIGKWADCQGVLPAPHQMTTQLDTGSKVSGSSSVSGQLTSANGYLFRFFKK